MYISRKYKTVAYENRCQIQEMLKSHSGRLKREKTSLNRQGSQYLHYSHSVHMIIIVK